MLGVGITGTIALLVARSSQAGELKKIEKQASVQQTALEREKITEMRRRYLTPLRYYAHALSFRLGELEVKFKSSAIEEARKEFEIAKNHVERKKKIDDYERRFYYEGIFAESTLYYTCSYFYYAREVRFNRPFDENRNVYAEKLGEFLEGVTGAFWRNEERGLWDTSQEMIGERFGKGGSAMAFAEMLQEHQADETFRRAVFLRPLDFYWWVLDAGWTDQIKTSLDKLVEFLDKYDPQTYGIPVQQGTRYELMRPGKEPIQ